MYVTDFFVLPFSYVSELNTTGGTNLPPATPISQSAVSAQNLVMSSSGVGGDGSVTLTLADTQGMLSGGLDAVTLNITSQVRYFSELTDKFMFLSYSRKWRFCLENNFVL